MTFLNNINQLRHIEWGKSFLWDFRIPEAPSPFNTFFPAVDIEENLDNLESLSIEAYNSTFKFPKSRTVKDIKVTFVDDVNGTGLSFFTQWVSNRIFKDNERNSATATLQDASKQVIVQKLSPSRDNVLLQSSYLVYPEGPLVYRGNSESGSQIHSITLVIVGTISIGERGD